MKNRENFEDILNSCFDRILKGQTVEDCLADHPDQAKELEPLLRTFSAARMAAQINPRAEFKSQAKYQFQVALAGMAGEKKEKASRGWHWRWQSAWSIAIVAVLLVIVAGAGTVVAAGRSMPDSILYSVKLASEHAQLALTFSDEGKAQFNATLAERRVAEIGYMASQGNAQEVLVLARNMNNNLKNMVSLAGGEGISAERATSGTPSNALSAPAKGADNSSQGVMGAASSLAPPAPSAPVAVPPQTTRPAPVTTAPAATIPATTAAPTTTVPGVTLTPSPTFAPTPAATTPPMSVTQAAPVTAAPETAKATAGPAFGAVQTDQYVPPAQTSPGPETEKSKLARLALENAALSIEKLNGILSSASPEVRPALRQAIAEAQTEYDQAFALLNSLGFQVP